MRKQKRKDYTAKWEAKEAAGELEEGAIFEYETSSEGQLDFKGHREEKKRIANYDVGE